MRKIYDLSQEYLEKHYVKRQKNAEQICEELKIKSKTVIFRLLKKYGIKPNSKEGIPHKKTKKIGEIHQSYLYSLKERVNRKNLKFNLNRRYVVSCLVCLLAVTFAVSEVAQAGVASGYFLTNGKAGDESKVYSGSDQSWTVTPTSGVSIQGGTLWMKSGEKTSASVTFSVSPALGGQSASKTLSFADFSGQVGKSTDFGWHRFSFSTPFQLTAGQSYTLKVSSSAALNTESKWYMLIGVGGTGEEKGNGKSGDKDDHNAGHGIQSPLFLDEDNNPATPPITPNAVPEPASLALAGIGLAAAGCVSAALSLKRKLLHLLIE